MGILLVSLAGGIVLISILITIITKTSSFLAVILLASIVLPIGMSGGLRPPIEEYPYAAKIYDSNNHLSLIDFKTFTQEGNVIRIDEYAENGYTFWANFKEYTIKKNLVIQLTDNLNRFTYFDRKTGTEINPKIATQ